MICLRCNASRFVVGIETFILHCHDCGFNRIETSLERAQILSDLHYKKTGHHIDIHHPLHPVNYYDTVKGQPKNERNPHNDNTDQEKDYPT